MASPWKFLARLVLPRRQQKQDDGSIKDEKPDALAIAGVTEATPEGGLSTAERSTREKAQSLVQSEPVSTESEPLVKTGSDLQGTEESDSDASAEISDLALPDVSATLAYPAPRGEETAKAKPAKRRGRAKTIKAVAVVSQTSPVATTISNEMSLDQEIRFLRDQLANKLRLQNAQLKQMLERFER